MVDKYEHRTQFFMELPEFVRSIDLTKKLRDNLERHTYFRQFKTPLEIYRTKREKVIYILLIMTRERSTCRALVELLRESGQIEIANRLEHLNLSKGSMRFSNDIEIPITKATAPKIDLSNCYNLVSGPRGKCIIINNVEDQQIPDVYNEKGELILKPLGLKRETERFEYIFTQLYFEVKILTKLNAIEMKETFINISKDISLKNSEAFVVIVISHGENEKILGFNACEAIRKVNFKEIKGKAMDEALQELNRDVVDIKEIIKIFSEDNCSQLKSVPKLFFCICCRVKGNNSDSFKRNKTDQDEYVNVQSPKKLTDGINLDTFVCFACSEGHDCFYDTKSGMSFFGQAFTHSIAQYSCEEPLSGIMSRTSTRLKEIYSNIKESEEEIKLKGIPTLPAGSFAIEINTYAMNRQLYFNPGIVDEDYEDYCPPQILIQGKSLHYSFYGEESNSSEEDENSSNINKKDFINQGENTLNDKDKNKEESKSEPKEFFVSYNKTKSNNEFQQGSSQKNYDLIQSKSNKNGSELNKKEQEPKLKERYLDNEESESKKVSDLKKGSSDLNINKDYFKNGESNSNKKELNSNKKEFDSKNEISDLKEKESESNEKELNSIKMLTDINQVESDSNNEKSDLNEKQTNSNEKDSGPNEKESTDIQMDNVPNQSVPDSNNEISDLNEKQSELNEKELNSIQTSTDTNHGESDSNNELSDLKEKEQELNEEVPELNKMDSDTNHDGSDSNSQQSDSNKEKNKIIVFGTDKKENSNFVSSCDQCRYYLTNGSLYYCNDQNIIDTSDYNNAQLINSDIKFNYIYSMKMQSKKTNLTHVAVSGKEIYYLKSGKIIKTNFEELLEESSKECLQNQEFNIGVPKPYSVSQSGTSKIQSNLNNIKISQNNVSKLKIPPFNENVEIYRENLEILGHGSYGLVLKNYNKEDGSPFATKQISKSQINYPNKDIEQIKESFQKELNVLKSCDEKYVVKYYNDRSDDDYFYIDMEYCNGNLKDVINQKAQFFKRNPSKKMQAIEYFITCEIFKEILECVNYLHEFKCNGVFQPIIHRDLKPDNILIKENPVNGRFIKLGDFGLATFDGIVKTVSHTEGSGTLKYRAREIDFGVKGRSTYSTKADIYSLHVIAMELFEFDYNNTEDHITNDEKCKTASKSLETQIGKMSNAKYKLRPNCKTILETFKTWSIDLNDYIISSNSQEYAEIRLHKPISLDNFFRNIFIEKRYKKETNI